MILPAFALFLGALFMAPSVTKAEHNMMCTMQYDPVCGVENGVYKTYGNSCVLGSEHGTYVHKGECTASELAAQPSTGGSYVPPKSCTAWFDGCNRCSKDANGNTMCTLSACVGEPAPGYCTAYQRPNQESPKPDPIDTITTVSATATSAELTAVVDALEYDKTPGFLERLWTMLSNWFNALF